MYMESAAKHSDSYKAGSMHHEKTSYFQQQTMLSYRDREIEVGQVGTIRSIQCQRIFRTGQRTVCARWTIRSDQCQAILLIGLSRAERRMLSEQNMEIRWTLKSKSWQWILLVGLGRTGQRVGGPGMLQTGVPVSRPSQPGVAMHKWSGTRQKTALGDGPSIELGPARRKYDRRRGE